MIEIGALHTIKGESGTAEKVSLVCDILVLSVLVWDQIRYGLNMLFLIVPLILIGLYLYFYCVIPEEYIFFENWMRIDHKLRKPVLISYDSVFNFEASIRDGFINIGQSNKVKLYCQIKGKKRAVVCRPHDVVTFIELIKDNCSEFHGETGNHEIEAFLIMPNSVKKGDQ